MGISMFDGGMGGCRTGFLGRLGLGGIVGAPLVLLSMGGGGGGGGSAIIAR